MIMITLHIVIISSPTLSFFTLPSQLCLSHPAGFKNRVQDNMSGQAGEEKIHNFGNYDNDPLFVHFTFTFDEFSSLFLFKQLLLLLLLLFLLLFL
jgi:hypothetical protein